MISGESKETVIHESCKEKGVKNVAFKLALPTLFEEQMRFLIENGLGSQEKRDVHVFTKITEEL